MNDEESDWKVSGKWKGMEGRGGGGGYVYQNRISRFKHLALAAYGFHLFSSLNVPFFSVAFKQFQLIYIF